MTVATRKSAREEFARFYEQPSREHLRDLLRNHVGETKHVEFKENWPAFARLAKHVLGLANSGGGVIVVGVHEADDGSLEACGVQAFTDKAVVLNGVKRHLPERLLSALDILDFSYDASEYPLLVGKRFQVLFVETDLRYLPFLALADGDGVRANTIYVRRGAATEEATHDEAQAVINERVETGYSSRIELDLLAHIEQLKILYNNIVKERRRWVGPAESLLQRTILQLGMGGREEVQYNAAYPKETFDEFIARMIAKKKLAIEVELGVSDAR